MCSRPFRPVGLPIYVARVPAAPFARCPTRSLLPSQLTLITRTTSCSRQLPSCVAVYPRDSRSRRVLCLPRRSVGEGGSLIPFAPLCRASSRRAQPLNRGAEIRDDRDYGNRQLCSGNNGRYLSLGCDSPKRVGSHCDSEFNSVSLILTVS